MVKRTVLVTTMSELDIQAMFTLLVKVYGCSPTDIISMCSTKSVKSAFYPSSDNTMDHMDVMINNSKPGDDLLLYFSGHGERLNERQTLNNTRDVEYMELSDYSFLNDTDLRDMSLEFHPEAHFIVVSSCMSGGLIEGAQEQVGDSAWTSIVNSWEWGLLKKGGQRGSDKKDRNLLVDWVFC
jgi:hypothetical protein